MVVLGSYGRKIFRWKIVLEVLLYACFISFICMALFLNGKAYYVFAKYTPFSAILYIGAAMRYMDSMIESMAFDIIYLMVIIGLICAVAISHKKYTAMRVLYVICICDIVVNLWLSNISGIIGDVIIMIAAKNTTKSIEDNLSTGDGSI